MAAAFSFLVLVSALSIGLFRAGLHTIDEGFVGVYYRGGRLLEETAEAGYHFALPLVTRVEQVQITVQTDRVTNVLCGTTSGVNIVFESIEVSNRLAAHAVVDVVRNFSVNYDKTLIFDRVASEVAQLCSRHSLADMREKFQSVDEILLEALQINIEKLAPSSLDIINIRVSTPVVPETIAKLFLEQEAERARLKVAVEQQRVAEKKAETQRLERKLEAESRAEVLSIENAAKLAERESQRLASEIEDKRIASQIKSLADAHYYSAERTAAANKLLHTAAFVQLELGRSLANNTKVFFGAQISSLFQSMVSDLLEHKQQQ